MRAAESPSPSSSGVLFASGAFFIWGINPLYFSLLRSVSAYEILAHRVLWSVVLLALLLWLTRGFAQIRPLFGSWRLLAALALSSALVAGNWLTFVWAVNSGRVLETSLGYFLNPLLSVLLGFVCLGERLRPAQWLAVALAALGVFNQIVLLGQLPWVSLVLAVTFGFYGLLRKKLDVDSISGLLVETSLAAPLALLYLAYLGRTGRLAFGQQGPGVDVLLALLGVVTAVPLMLFAAGARRLRLGTLGFLQYLAPSMTFLLATLVYGENLGIAGALTFALIWGGIIIYAVDAWRRSSDLSDRTDRSDLSDRSERAGLTSRAGL